MSGQNGIEGKNDIEFIVDDVENVKVIGNASDDKITLGEGSQYEGYSGFINLNDDDDADVWDEDRSVTAGAAIWADVQLGDGSVTVDGAGGDDEISAKGDHGTGPAVGSCATEIGVSLAGSAGDDDIQGGEGNDWLSGGAGDDVIDGNGSAENNIGGAECGVDLDIATGQLEDPYDLSR